MYLSEGIHSFVSCIYKTSLDSWWKVLLVLYPFSRKWDKVLFEAFYLKPQGNAYMHVLESHHGFKFWPIENEKPINVRQSIFLRWLLTVVPSTLAQSLQRAWLWLFPKASLRHEVSQIQSKLTTNQNYISFKITNLSENMKSAIEMLVKNASQLPKS